MVFPNPWRLDRDGGLDIVFAGLAVNSTVKIFTLAARHVRPLDAAAGNVIWDRKNAGGTEVVSGIYIYVIKTGDSIKKGKLAVIKQRCLKRMN